MTDSLTLSIHGTHVHYSAEEGWIANDGLMARHLNNVSAEWVATNEKPLTIADAEAIARDEYKEAVTAWAEPVAREVPIPALSNAPSDESSIDEMPVAS